MPAKSRGYSLRSHLSPAGYRGLPGRGCRAFVRVSTTLAGDGPHGPIILMHSASASVMRITRVTVSTVTLLAASDVTLVAPLDRLARLSGLSLHALPTFLGLSAALFGRGLRPSRCKGFRSGGLALLRRMA